MKITYSIIMFLFFLVNVFGQGLKIVATAKNGKKDSIRFGFKNNATMGIDENLGEIDITNQPIGEVDMRVAQRDSINFSCTYTFRYNKQTFDLDTIKHFFPVSFDSKINYRKARDTSFINRVFEVKFSTKNIMNIQIYPEPTADIYASLDSFTVFIDSCLNEVNPIRIDLSAPYPPLNIRGSSIFSNLIFIFKKGYLLDYKENTVIQPKIYPNPFKNVLNIDGIAPNKVKKIVIVDFLGRQIFKQNKDYITPIELDIEHLNCGTYFLNAFDKDSKRLFSKLIVKE